MNRQQAKLWASVHTEFSRRKPATPAVVDDGSICDGVISRDDTPVQKGAQVVQDLRTLHPECSRSR